MAVNATENHMSGVCLVAEPFCLVVVEGCGKAAKRWAAAQRRAAQEGPCKRGWEACGWAAADAHMHPLLQRWCWRRRC